MQEIWKPVPSKPGVFASSLGRVKQNPFEKPMPNGGVRMYEPKPTYGVKTKSSKKARHEYMAYVTRLHGNMKVHRLVCEAFHGCPPFQKAVVLHLDEDATNNSQENLKWGTQKENLNMPGFVAYCKSRIGDKSPVIKGRASKNA